MEEHFGLSFGTSTTKHVKADHSEAHGRGLRAMEEFIQKMLVNNSTLFHEPIKLMKLEPFASMGVMTKVKRS